MPKPIDQVDLIIVDPTRPRNDCVFQYTLTGADDWNRSCETQRNPNGTSKSVKSIRHNDWADHQLVLDVLLQAATKSGKWVVTDGSAMLPPAIESEPSPPPSPSQFTWSDGKGTEVAFDIQGTYPVPGRGPMPVQATIAPTQGSGPWSLTLSTGGIVVANGQFTADPLLNLTLQP